MSQPFLSLTTFPRLLNFPPPNHKPFCPRSTPPARRSRRSRACPVSLFLLRHLLRPTPRSTPALLLRAARRKEAAHRKQRAQYARNQAVIRVEFVVKYLVVVYYSCFYPLTPPFCSFSPLFLLFDRVRCISFRNARLDPCDFLAIFLPRARYSFPPSYTLLSPCSSLVEM